MKKIKMQMHNVEIERDKTIIKIKITLIMYERMLTQMKQQRGQKGKDGLQHGAASAPRLGSTQLLGQDLLQGAECVLPLTRRHPAAGRAHVEQLQQRGPHLPRRDQRRGAGRQVQLWQHVRYLHQKYF